MDANCIILSRDDGRLGVIFGEQASALIGSPSLLLPIAIGIIIIVAGLNMLGSKLEESYKLFLQFVS